MSERHPIEISPFLPLEDRMRLLESHLARLWDQVWWLSLSEQQRKEYRDQGFTDPIEHFYIES